MKKDRQGRGVLQFIKDCYREPDFIIIRPHKGILIYCLSIAELNRHLNNQDYSSDFKLICSLVLHW